MNVDDLVRMINQIAEFFVAYPEAEAVDGVTEHLEKFWDPAMRTQMVHERRACADRLHPLASKALDALADGEA